MSFDWLHYTEIAHRLAESPFIDYQEACYRSAISRAYYGAFCLCRDRAALKNYIPASETDLPTHKKVIQTYKGSPHKKEKNLGRTLDELRRLRNRADYEGEKEIKTNDVKRAILMMSEIIKAL
jgi:uncharacterized protein (UPF0332 family)